MEIKEFNSVEEAIEALNNIKPIDYSSLDEVDEISERAFYNMLMNNFIGTKNLKFTPEQRRNYQEALRRKGLLTYKEWKNSRPKDPEEPEKMDWNYVIEHGKLDGPVNIFSNIMNAQDEKHFDRIRDLTITDKLHSKVGKMWAEKNDEILEVKKAEREVEIAKIKEAEAELEKQRIEAEARAVEEAEEKKRAEEAQKIIAENEMAEEEIKATMEKVGQEVNKIKAEENKVEEPKTTNGWDGKTRRIDVVYFASPEEAIAALKQIGKIEYIKGEKIDSNKEKEFYAEVSKNLMGCQKLEFSDDISAKYQETLKSIGCKEKEELIELKDDVKSIEVAEEYIDQVLKATSGDHYQGLKDARSKADMDKELEGWIASAEYELLLENYANKKSKISEKEAKAGKKETAMVEYKPKPKWFKKLATRAALFATSVIGLFGINKMNVGEKNIDANEKDNKAKVESDSMGIENTADEALKDLGVKNLEKQVSKDFGEELNDKHVADHVKHSNKEDRENNGNPYEEDRKNNGNPYDDKVPEDKKWFDKLGNVNDKAKVEEKQMKEEHKKEKEEEKFADEKAKNEALDVEVVTPKEEQKVVTDEGSTIITEDDKDIDTNGGVKVENLEDNVSFVTPGPKEDNVEEIVVKFESEETPEIKEDITVKIDENLEQEVVEFDIEDGNKDKGKKDDVIEMNIGF